jgi:hypothetical protein
VDELRWYVHVQGPDDLIPADGMLDAMRKAARINSENVSYLEGRGRPVTAFTPLSWAVPVRPGDPVTAHITDTPEADL